MPRIEVAGVPTRNVEDLARWFVALEEASRSVVVGEAGVIVNMRFTFVPLGIGSAIAEPPADDHRDTLSNMVRIVIDGLEHAAVISSRRQVFGVNAIAELGNVQATFVDVKIAAPPGAPVLERLGE